MAFSYSEFVKKKVLGVPVLYIAAAAVTILAIVAWRMKATPDTSVDGTSPEEAVAGANDPSKAGSLAGMDNAYDGFDTNGTVVVQPTVPTGQPVVEETNDTWLAKAIPAAAKKLNVSQGNVQAALVKYLNGEDLSFAEGQMRDTAIEEAGLPPEGVTSVGTVGTLPAQKQFSMFPGTHTVKGNNDNSASKIASLYYGNGDALHADKIAAANYKYGPTSTTYSVGDKIYVPAWVTPGYFISTKTVDTASEIAAKSGISVQVLQSLNPGMTFPVKPGTKVRNH